MQLSMRSLRSERPREVPWDRECKVRTRHLEAEVSAKNLEENADGSGNTRARIYI
jgi:hypothetical protein